jgi:hypothetical protein
MKSPRWDGHVNMELDSDLSDTFSVSIIRVYMISFTEAFGNGTGGTLPHVE